MKIRVYYEDTDSGGVVYHANYIKFCERARSEILFNKNAQTFSQNGEFVVVKLNANFIKPAFLGDILEVSTKLISYKNASLVLCHEIKRISSLNSANLDQTVCICEIKLAYLVGKKPAKFSQNIVNLLTNHSSSNPNGVVL